MCGGVVGRVHGWIVDCRREAAAASPCSARSANLMADQDAWVTMGGKEIPVTATRLHGADSDRELRVFMLTRR